MSIAEYKKLGPIDDLIELIRRAKIPKPKREHRFRKNRKFAFDLCWPSYGIAVEVEGGIWKAGRHVRGAGYEADCEKYSLAAIDGWAVIRVTPGMIKSGKAMELITEAWEHCQRA